MDLHEFENLNPDEQEKIFHKSSFKEKGELLMHSHNPAALTRSLSQEELYLVTREMDAEERGEVIRYATLPQLFFIADLDCWRKDRFYSRGFLKWLEALLAAGDDKVLIWLCEMDFESVVAGFQQVMEVLKPDREWTLDEVLGDRPYFSLDQMYYISGSEENLETVKRAIEILFENRRGRYTAILEGILGELPDEAEEEAYKRREIRLAERGFPDFETAQQIYRPLTAQEFENYPKKRASSEIRDLESAIPNYLVLWSQERFFLDDVLHSFQNDTTGTRDKLQEELAWISNKVIAGAGIDFSSEKKVRRGIERARGFINIGLEQLSGRDFSAAREILEERWLEVIFRWGATQVFLLREQAWDLLKNYWKSNQVGLLNFLDSPFDTIYTGIIRAVPECYDASILGDEPLRDFKNLEDMERTRRALDQLKVLHKNFVSRFSKDFQKVQEEAGKMDSESTLFSFLGALLHKSHPSSTLETSAKEAFMASLLEKKDRELCLPIFALFFERLQEKPKATPKKRKTAKAKHD